MLRIFILLQVVIADVGSMHGTFMAGPNLIGGFPDKLKPRRNYTLRDGDIVLFGKTINRDDRVRFVFNLCDHSYRLTHFASNHLRTGSPLRSASR